MQTGFKPNSREDFMGDGFRQAALGLVLAGGVAFAHAGTQSLAALNAGQGASKASDPGLVFASVSDPSFNTSDIRVLTTTALWQPGEPAGRAGSAVRVSSPSRAERDDASIDPPMTEPGRIALFVLGLVALGCRIGRRAG
jgi:hypothetical protein